MVTNKICGYLGNGECTQDPGTSITWSTSDSLGRRFRFGANGPFLIREGEAVDVDRYGWEHGLGSYWFRQDDAVCATKIT